MTHDCNHVDPGQMTIGPCPNCPCFDHHPEHLCMGCDEVLCADCWNEHEEDAPCHVDQEHEGTVADRMEAQPIPTAACACTSLCHAQRAALVAQAAQLYMNMAKLLTPNT